MSMLNTLLVIGLVAYVVTRRMMGQPLTARDVFVPPVVLIALGVHSVSKVHLTGADIAWLLALGVVGVLFGVLRSATTHLYRRDEVLWQRYTWRTIGAWVLTAVLSVGLGALATATGMHDAARPIQLSIGLGLLGEAAITFLRARALAIPYAPDRR